MIRESELVHLPLLKENFEAIDMQVEKVIYSREPLQVIGLKLKDVNGRRKKNLVLPYKKIKKINKENIFLVSEKDIILFHQIPEIKEALLNPMKIIGFSIHDHNGDLIGVIKDTLIEIKNGRVLGFVISEGMFDDLVRGYSILPLVNAINFNEENIMIKEKDLQLILPQGGGLKKLLGID